MEPTVTAGWSDFLVGAAGAAGALAGLVFVALSINLSRIIELPGVAGRAAETILLLAAALIGTLLALVPQPATHLGAWLVLVGLCAWIMPTVVQIQAYRRREFQKRQYAVRRFVLHEAATIPIVVAGVSLWFTGRSGLGWFAAGVLLSLSVAILNAWVLLVEIVR